MIAATLPPGSLYRPCAGIYTANYNTPTLGKYSWDTPANTGVQLLKLNKNNIYLLSSLNFSATIANNNYLENISVVPSLDLRLQLAGAQLNGQGYPLVTYMQNNEIMIWFWTTQQDDYLISNFRGILNQNAALAAIASVTAQCSLNIFEVTNAAYIAKIKALPQEQGAYQVPVSPEILSRI